MKDGNRVYKDKNGVEKSAPNGMYYQSDGSIWIDLNAGNFGQGTILHTAAHELTHFIKQWSPQKFKALADFLVEQYGEKGVSVDTLVKRQQQKAKNNGREISYDEAFEEFVADSMTSMLNDGKVIRELCKKDMTLGEKIKSWIDGVLKKLSSIYKDYELETEEGKLVSQMTDSYKKIQSLFTDALSDASENFANTDIQAQKNTAENSGVKMQIRKNTDGNLFVDVENIVVSESNSAKEISKILSNIVKEKFSDLVNANGQKIGIKQRTAKEWQNSKNAQYLLRNDSRKYFDKINSFSNADELLKASREYVGEEIKHIRQDSFVEFARGMVDFKVDDRGYSADIIVGTTKDGKALLYDIVNIVYKKIESASNTGQFRRSDTLSTDSINQKDSSVNSYSMQQDKNNSDASENFNNSANTTQKNTTQEGDVKLQVREDFAEQLNDWVKGKGKAFGKYNGKYFDLGTTSDVLIKHGAPNAELIMYEDCLVKITGGKHAISLDELSKLPIELDDPVLLFSGSVPNSFVALTELVDVHGNDVIAIVHIDKRYGRSVINKIASVYSKIDQYDNNKIINYVRNQIEQGNLIDASIKKAPTWFTSRGLQLPKLVQTTIDANSNNKVPQKEPVVNTYSMQESKNNSKKFSDRDVARYTEKQYNDFGWASYNDVITTKERETLLSRYADFKHNKDKYPVTRFGETVVHSDDCPDVIMYVKGSIASPKITKVLRIDYFNTAEIKEEILNNERRHLSEPYAAIEYFYGEEILSISKARDYASFQEYKSEQKRSNSGESDTNSPKQQDGNGSIGENQDSNEKSDQIKRSDRDYSAISNRSLLADALETAATNETEREWLGRYKEQISSLNEDQKKLDEINAEIREISFTKGTDRSKLTALSNNKKTLVDRIERADKKLLQFEAVKPLKDILQREKQKAVKRQKAKDAEILKEYKEKSLSKIEETKKRYQESRHKNVEGRQKTELRNKIKKTVKKLNHLLVHGSKEHNIKIELQDTARKAILAADQLFDEDGGEGILK
ncbi:MAG: hypothetical protein UHH95_01510 [Oscillospiraceae bacterium]|nr:hypothetical protein [Oscillospiraceae bacterium]